MKLLSITEQEFNALCSFFADVSLPYRSTGPMIGMLNRIMARNGIDPTEAGMGGEEEGATATAKPVRKKATKKKAAKKASKRRSKR